MRPHTKLYMDAFDYCIDDYICSELNTSKRCNDVHHIDARGMGGTSKEDRIEELMGVTREEHVKYGDKKHYMCYLYTAHRSAMLKSGVKFDEDYINNKIEYWKDYGPQYL